MVFPWFCTVDVPYLGPCPSISRAAWRPEAIASPRLLRSSGPLETEAEQVFWSKYTKANWVYNAWVCYGLLIFQCLFFCFKAMVVSGAFLSKTHRCPWSKGVGMRSFRASEANPRFIKLIQDPTRGTSLTFFEYCALGPPKATLGGR